MPIDLKLLGRTLKQVQYQQHRSVDEQLGTAGTTLVQWDALRAIDRNPRASAHVLARATFQSDQAFGTLANRLEAQGLIERRPGEGRRIEHKLTTKGERVLKAGQGIMSEVLADLYSVLSEKEQQTLLDLLMRLLRNRDAP
jgi:DNA-binding MarR family transcriptional regulator